MLINSTTKVAILGSLVLLASACSGEAHDKVETFGELTVTINGETQKRQTLYSPSDNSATAEYTTFGPIKTISIQAHLPGSFQNAFSLTLSINGDGTSVHASESSIAYFPTGLSGPFYLSEDTDKPVTVTLSKLNLDDNPSIAGSFEGIMCRKENIQAEIDINHCLPAKGSFDTQLGKF